MAANNLDVLVNREITVLMGGWSAEREISLKTGKAVIDARGASSAASAANAAIDTVKAVDNKTEEGDWFSAAVPSDGSYGIPEDLIFGFPLTSNGQGKVDIVQGIELNDFAQAKIKITTDELLSEKEAVKDLLD